MEKDISTFKTADMLDIEAVQKIQSGDNGGFNHIFDKYHKFILSSMLKKTGSMEVAEDLAMEVISKVFTKINLYKVDKTVNSWVTVISKNHFTDYYKSLKRGPGHISIDNAIPDDDSTEPTTHELHSNLLNGEQELIRKERHAEVRNAIEELDPKSANIVKLRYFEGLSYQEVADRLDIKLSSVKITLFRAKSKIKKSLKR